MSQRPEPESAVRGFMFERVRFKAGGETIPHPTHRREINKAADLRYLSLVFAFQITAKTIQDQIPLGFNVPSTILCLLPLHASMSRKLKQI